MATSELTLIRGPQGGLGATPRDMESNPAPATNERTRLSPALVRDQVLQETIVIGTERRRACGVLGPGLFGATKNDVEFKGPVNPN